MQLVRLSSVATLGRPLKYGEALIPRQFRLPESLSDELTAAARNRKANVSDLVIAALERELRPTEKPKTNADVANEIGDRLEDIEALLRRRESNGAVSFKLPEEDHHLLVNLSASFGFAELGHFARSLTERALDHSREEVQEWLLGDITREVEAQMAAEEEERKAA